MPKVNGKWQTWAQYMIELKRQFPHHVDIKKYRAKRRAGIAPKIEGRVSWVKYHTKHDATRTFGFKTTKEAQAFSTEINNLEGVRS